MPQKLKNKNLEITIDLPHENYNLPRFDWTGKIVTVQYQGKHVTGTELADAAEDTFCGKGFYNEFGINAPVGFDETEAGGWFHKIGVGLLRKEEGPYDFSKAYEIQPLEFEVATGADKLRIKCQAPDLNGYSYFLEKEIALLENGFQINYYLENTGKRTITTNEYNHNFLAIDRALIGRDYVLKFPFQIQPALFGETVNPEKMVDIGRREVTFRGNPQEPFFFSNLSGGETVDAQWALKNTKSKIGISETGNFRTHSVNLWGWGHVVSPELFFHIMIQPGQSEKWSRTYHVYDIL